MAEYLVLGRFQTTYLDSDRILSSVSSDRIPSTPLDTNIGNHIMTGYYVGYQIGLISGFDPDIEYSFVTPDIKCQAFTNTGNALLYYLHIFKL